MMNSEKNMNVQKGEAKVNVRILWDKENPKNYRIDIPSDLAKYNPELFNLAESEAKVYIKNIISVWVKEVGANNSILNAKFKESVERIVDTEKYSIKYSYDEETGNFPEECEVASKEYSRLYFKLKKNTKAWTGWRHEQTSKIWVTTYDYKDIRYAIFENALKKSIERLESKATFNKIANEATELKAAEDTEIAAKLKLVGFDYNPAMYLGAKFGMKYGRVCRKVIKSESDSINVSVRANVGTNEEGMTFNNVRLQGNIDLGTLLAIVEKVNEMKEDIRPAYESW